MSYKTASRTSQGTHCVSMRTTNLLMLFGEIIALYYENHAKYINTSSNRIQSIVTLKQVVHVVTSVI
jgi:hypothetical protein